MPHIALPEGVSIHCAVDDYLWPWETPTPVLMMHGFARNATVLEPLGSGDRRQPSRLSARSFGLRHIRCSGRRAIATLRKRSARRSSRCSMRCRCRGYIGSASPRAGSSGCCSPRHIPNALPASSCAIRPTRIPDGSRGSTRSDQESTAAAIRAHGTGEWCRQTLGYRLDLEHASAALQEWVMRRNGQDAARTSPPPCTIVLKRRHHAASSGNSQLRCCC